MKTNDTESDINLSVCCPLRGNEHWWIFIVTNIVLYIIGLSLSSLSYLIFRLVKRSKGRQKKSATITKVNSSRLFNRFRANIQQLISGDTIPSKILITLTFVCNIIYLLTYIYRTYTPFPEGTVDGKCLISSDAGLNNVTDAIRIEKCFTLSSSPEFWVELVVILELTTFAFIRFLATDSVVYYWLDPYTLVDIFTLPHIFISITLGVDWIGVRSLRFILLPQIVNVIRFLPFVKSQDAVDVISLLIKFSALWLSCTGIIHLVEVQGDFWRNYENGGTDAFLTYAYFILVTVSTVGYGDITPSTDIGRAFITFFIILGLGFFAAISPTIISVASGFYAKRQFAKFDTTRVPKHIIVCGHITAFSAEEFLKDFLHPDRGDTQTHVLFLHPERPDPDLKNVIRSHFTRVQYIVGSVLNGKDLQRAKINTSQAVFIMADKFASTPLEEDNSNLLRLVSVKNTTTDVPVIIQLLLSTSKKQAYNIEGWKVGHDIALCLNELKLGLLAQSCICPGMSTLIANLFYTSNFPTLFKETDAWKKLYISGASNEIYASHFSHQFERKTFHEAATICYRQLGLILLSLERIDGKVRSCFVNPSPFSNPDLVIQSGEEGMLGYFIGEDLDHVSVVASYCVCCHGNENVNAGERSPQIKQLVRRVSSIHCSCLDEGAPFLVGTGSSLKQMQQLVHLGDSKETSQLKSRLKMLRMMSAGADSANSLDLAEQFSLYVSEPQKLEEAIVMDESAIDTKKLKSDVTDHVVLCVFADETSPLLGLHNFLLPLRSKYMPKDKLKPVVIVSNKRFIEREWPLIHNIPDVYVVVGSPLRWQNLEQAKINECSVCIILSMLSSTTGHELAVNDKESILCSLSIQEHLKKTAKRNILIITDLKLESNVQFLDFSDEDEPDERIYKAQPFACGEAFSVSMFDSVTSSVYHSPGTLYLIEELVHASGTITRCQVVPLSLEDYEGMAFKDLYFDQLKKNAICLGLYRKLPIPDSALNFDKDFMEKDIPQDSESSGPVKQIKHYVVTAPDPRLTLEKTDIAFLLVEQITTII